MGLKFQIEDNLDKMLENFVTLPSDQKVKEEDPILKKAMENFDKKEKKDTKK